MSRTSLENKNSDLVPDALIRIKALDFDTFEENLVAPVMTFRLNIYIKYMEDDYKGWSSHLKPFSINVWRAIFVWLLAFTAVVVIIGRKNKILNVDHFFLNLEALCSQGENVEYTEKICCS